MNHPGHQFQDKSVGDIKPQADHTSTKSEMAVLGRRFYFPHQPTILDKIKWDTLPYGREKAVSSPLPPFQCCNYAVKNFDINVDLQH